MLKRVCDKRSVRGITANRRGYFVNKPIFHKKYFWPTINHKREVIYHEVIY